MRKNFKLPNFRSLKPKNPWPFLSAVWRKFHRDNAFFLARGLAFDVLVCLIPALFLLFVLFGFLFDSSRETIQYMSSYMKSMIPFSQQQVLRNLFSVVRNQKVLGILGGIGIVWTLSRLFGTIRTVLDTIFEAKKKRSLLQGKIFDLKMMGVGSLFLLATVFVTSLSSMLRQMTPQTLGVKFLYLGMRGELTILLLGFVFTICLFFFLYKFVPEQKIQTRHALYSALAASILWELAKQIFRFYLMNVAEWNKVYGSFTLLFALVLWVYYSCIVFILGAEMGWAWSRKEKSAE